MISRQALRKNAKRKAQQLLKKLLGTNHENANANLSQESIPSCSSTNERSIENIDEILLIGNDTNENVNVIEKTDNDLRKFICEWSVKYGICVEAMNELLKKLREFDNTLPLDIRTIRGTPRKTEIIEMGKGSYFHYGLENCLTDFLYENELSDDITDLTINFGIDGLPLFKSSKKCLWPIMINDLSNFLEFGFIFQNKTYNINIGNFICDGPARAFLLNNKSYSGFYCCTKCDQKGEYFKRRITFPLCPAEPRTDESFKTRVQKEHHTKLETLDLETFGVGCVSKFPLDYMHVFCLGVTRQVLKLWTKQKGNTFTLDKDKILAISNGNIKLYKQFCSDFNRVPRTLDELDRWKATEYRSFLLYSSIVILRNILSDCVYNHFCKLHIAIRILCNDKLCQQCNSKADIC
ncbi:hypothetical protein CVS40_12868 [Lucilia cuprina]|nr:hypothetical protein CVS40_12868 [Lucilia cuprina]